jgi:D-tyrosyl-tRNA(Tyr) deacylase
MPKTPGGVDFVADAGGQAGWVGAESAGFLDEAGMRAVIQRVSEAAVRVGGQVVGEIGVGLLVLLGVEDGDERADAEWLAGKIARMRIFPDGSGQMNVSLLDIGGGALVVSQFTLHALTRKGNRPSFIRAARPEHSEPLCEEFCERLEGLLGRPVARGRFAADMKVGLVNDGPVTIIIDSRERRSARTSPGSD